MTPEEARNLELEVTEKGKRYLEALTLKTEKRKRNVTESRRLRILLDIEKDGNLNSILKDYILTARSSAGLDYVTKDILHQTGWLIDHGFVEVIGKRTVSEEWWEK